MEEVGHLIGTTLVPNQPLINGVGVTVNVMLYIVFPFKKKKKSITLYLSHPYLQWLGPLWPFHINKLV